MNNGEHSGGGNRVELSRHVADAVERATGDETVLWIGKPDPGLAFRRSAWLWMIGIPWFAFTFTAGLSLFLPPHLRPISIPPGTKLWEIMLIGLIVWAHAAAAAWLCFRPFTNLHRMRNRAYVVTNASLMTVTALPAHQIEVTRVPIGEIDQWQRSDLPGGRGILTIRHRDRRPAGLAREPETWLGIADASRVEQLITGLIIGPKSPHRPSSA